MNTRTHTLPTGTIDKASKGTTYFTPLDTIDTHLDPKRFARLSSRVLDSMAWMIDSACINLARNIMWNTYKNRDDSLMPQTLVEWAGNFADVLDRDEIYNGTKDDNRLCEIESDENTLAMLLGLRVKWHDAAYHAAADDGREYDNDPKKPKGKFSHRLAETGKTDIDAHELAMVKYDVRKLAKDEAHFQRLLADHLKTLEEGAKQAAEDRKLQAPIMLEILRVVGRHKKPDARFDQLPIKTQKMLTNFAIGAINRPKEDLRKQMARKEPLAYTHLSDAAWDAVQELEYVLRTKYAETGELENTGDMRNADDLGKARNEKSFACEID